VGKHWREWKLKKHCFQGNGERWRRRRSLRSHHHTSQSQPTTFSSSGGEESRFSRLILGIPHPSPVSVSDVSQNFQVIFFLQVNK
jgi:hypothetical protein